MQEKVEKLTSPFMNDPYALVALAFEKVFPKKKYTAFVVPELKDEDGETVYGATTFPNDGTPPVVEVSGEATVEGAVEILAHELAHVATPWDQEHGEAWETAFVNIYEEYVRICREKNLCGGCGG